MIGISGSHNHASLQAPSNPATQSVLITGLILGTYYEARFQSGLNREGRRGRGGERVGEGRGLGREGGGGGGEGGGRIARLESLVPRPSSRGPPPV